MSHQMLLPTFALFLLIHHYQTSCLMKMISEQSSSANCNELSVDNSPKLLSYKDKVGIMAGLKSAFICYIIQLLSEHVFFTLCFLLICLQVSTQKDQTYIVHLLVTHTEYFLPMSQLIFNLAYLYSWVPCNNSVSHSILSLQYCRLILCVRHLV